ncbi:MAG: ABC transporter substrate-binding protein [Chloroflexi bacterium]|nr:ABC transporter substrate-binding protein [Chloroflexota bacterium]
MRRLLAVLVLMAGLLSGCSRSDNIRIGVLSISSGPDAYVGQASDLALRDRVDELNAAGGIAGRKVELVIYDTRGEITEAVAAAHRLIDQDRVDVIIGPSWSGAAIPIAAIADEAQVPVIATTASNPLVTVDEAGAVHPFMFRVCFIDPYQGSALADFAYHELGLRRAGFITDITSPYSVGIQQFFSERFRALGGEVVAEEAYQANETEFRPMLTKVAAAGADVLMVPSATYRDIALAARQAAGLGINIQYLGVDGWMADDLLAMSGAELEGAYLASGVSTEAPRFAEFNAAFSAKHGIQPSIYAYYALDALAAIESAYYAAGSYADGPALAEVLANLKDTELFTSMVTVDPATHNPLNKPVEILQVRQGAWVLVKTYTPR